jgi:hypothetical protein
MKAIPARGIISCFFIPLFACLVIPALAQPDYNFQNGLLISGVNRQIGAVYHFANVRTGVDARVTIADISSGITVVDMDGNSGYPEALQPTLRANANTSGYLEMYFELFVAGTSTPYTATNLPVTCIDVDGMSNNDGAGKPIYEFDEINLGGGLVDFDGTAGELIISQTGNWYRGKNIAGIDYPGRDTSAKQVMFSVYNANVSTFTIRVGVDNQSSNVSDRLRSVYFKRFFYNNFPLVLPNLVNFEGNRNGNRIGFKWDFSTTEGLDRCVLERAVEAGTYSPVADFLYTGENAFEKHTAYTDNSVSKGNYNYRLKMIGRNGEIKYSSVLAFKTSAESDGQELIVYPSVITSGFTARFNADRTEPAQLQIVDYSGRSVYSKSVILVQGQNNISVSDFTAARGNFVIVVRKGGKIYSQKVIVQ